MVVVRGAVAVVADVSVMVSAPVLSLGGRPFSAAGASGRRVERPDSHHHLGVMAAGEMSIAVEPDLVRHGRTETLCDTAEQMPGGLVVRGDRRFYEVHASACRPREDVGDETLRQTLPA